MSGTTARRPERRKTDVFPDRLAFVEAIARPLNGVVIVGATVKVDSDADEEALHRNSYRRCEARDQGIRAARAA